MEHLQDNPRTTSLLAVANANNIKLDLVKTIPHENIGVDDDYKLLNKLGKIPTFVGSDGYVLTECIAIAIYRESIHFLYYKSAIFYMMKNLHHFQLSLSEHLMLRIVFTL